MTTVNGKNIGEVLAALRAKKTPSKDKLGKPYFSIKEYFNLFDDCVGVANYNVEYSDYTFTQTLSNQELYSVKCRITILDDDGKPVLFRECYGGYTTQQEKNTGKDVNLQNSTEFVCNTAFKNAAKKFGVFGKYEDVSGSTDSKPASKPANTNNGNGANKNGTSVRPAADTSAMDFVSNGEFKQISSKDGRPVYNLEARLVVGKVMEDKVSNIVFYPNQYENYASELNGYISECAIKQKRLHLKVSSLSERNGVKQFLFKGFDKIA